MTNWSRVSNSIMRIVDEIDGKWVMMRRYVPAAWGDVELDAHARGRVNESIRCDDGSWWQITELRAWDRAEDPKTPEGLQAIDIWVSVVRPAR